MAIKKIVFSAAALIAILITTFFYLYVSHVGSDISDNHEHWATFGTLLSAIFGLLAATFTFVTILVLSLQLYDQKKINQTQMATLEFDFYNKHKTAFNDLLDSIEKRFDNKYDFRNRDALYIHVFPQNDYFENGNKRIELISPDHSGLKNTINAFNSLEFRISSSDKLINFFDEIIDIHYALNIKTNERPTNGTMSLKNTTTPLNIFNIEESIYHLAEILERLSSFGGSKTTISLHSIKNYDIISNFFNNIKYHTEIQLGEYKVEITNEETKDIAQLLIVSSKHEELESIRRNIIHDLTINFSHNNKEQLNTTYLDELIEEALENNDEKYSEIEKDILEKSLTYSIPF